VASTSHWLNAWRYRLRSAIVRNRLGFAPARYGYPERAHNQGVVRCRSPGVGISPGSVIEAYGLLGAGNDVFYCFVA
jgi:hypothetical protein